MTEAQLNQIIEDNFGPSAGLVNKEKQKAVAEALRDLIVSNDIESAVSTWATPATYDTPATSETSGNPAYSIYLERIWQSKIDGNQGNQPPSDPNITEDANWLEVSKATASPFKEWTPGLYGAGLIVVYSNDELYKLNVAERPFNSQNITTEISEGKWTRIGSSAVALNETNGIIFSNLQAAIDAAADGDTVTVLKSFITTQEIRIRKPMILNLAGNTITNNAANQGPTSIHTVDVDSFTGVFRIIGQGQLIRSNGGTPPINTHDCALFCDVDGVQVNCDLIGENYGETLYCTASDFVLNGNMQQLGPGLSGTTCHFIFSAANGLINGNIYSNQPLFSFIVYSGSDCTITGNISLPNLTGAAAAGACENFRVSHTAKLTIQGSINAPNYHGDGSRPLLYLSVSGDDPNKDDTIEVHGFVRVQDSNTVVAKQGRVDPTVTTLIVKDKHWTNGKLDDLRPPDTVTYLVDNFGASASSDAGLLPDVYDPQAINIFIDPTYSGPIEAGTPLQPYKTNAQAVSQLESLTAGQFCHIYLKAGVDHDPIVLTQSSSGVSRFQRNRISKYGGGAYPRIREQADLDSWVLSSGSVYTRSVPSNFEGIWEEGSGMKYLVPGTLHAVDVPSTTATTITVPSLIGSPKTLVNSWVDLQPTQYDGRRLQITAFDPGTGVITFDTSKGGAFSLLSSIDHDIRLYGVPEDLTADGQLATGGNVLSFYSTSDPNTRNLKLLTNSDLIHLGDILDTYKYWDINSLDIGIGGRFGVSIKGEQSFIRMKDLYIHDIMSVCIAREGSYNTISDTAGNVYNETYNIICQNYGATAISQTRIRRSKHSMILCDWGNQVNGQYHGFIYQISTGVSQGSAIQDGAFRNIATDALDVARVENDWTMVFIFGAAESGMQCAGYKGKISSCFARATGQYFSDVASYYFGGNFTHGWTVSDCFSDGDDTGGPYFDQYCPSVTTGAVHAYYVDNYSFNMTFIRNTAVNHTLNDFSEAYKQNLGAVYNVYKYNLGFNNSVGYRRADEFAALVAPCIGTTFRDNTLIAVSRKQYCAQWVSRLAGNVPFTDYDPGDHDFNRYVSIANGAAFQPSVQPILSLRAADGTSFQVFRDAIGGNIEVNSVHEYLHEYEPFTDYAEDADITAHNGGAGTFPTAPGAPAVGLFGNAVWESNDGGRLKLTPDTAAYPTLGSVDATNSITLNDEFYGSHAVLAGQIFTIDITVKGDAVLATEGEKAPFMYFDVRLWDGAAYVDSRRTISVTDEYKTYTIQFKVPTNFVPTGSFITIRPFTHRSTGSDALYFTRFKFFDGSGTETMAESAEVACNLTARDYPSIEDTKIMVEGMGPSVLPASRKGSVEIGPAAGAVWADLVHRPTGRIRQIGYASGKIE